VDDDDLGVLIFDLQGESAEEGGGSGRHRSQGEQDDKLLHQHRYELKLGRDRLG